MGAQPETATQASHAAHPFNTQDAARGTETGNFPLHVLPKRIQAFINECARSLSASAEMVVYCVVCREFALATENEFSFGITERTAL
mgnify:CR=1 FL=1